MSFFRKLFRSKGWDRFPVEFVESLKEILGEEKFDSLTLLAKKHHLFEQNLFAHPENFTDIREELTNVEIACLLTSMGNELYRRQIVEDAETIHRIVITIRPDHAAARGSLAWICYDSGRDSEAKEHARKAIADMDTQTERYKDIDLPEEIAPPNATDSFRSMLQLIAEGQKKAISKNLKDFIYKNVYELAVTFNSVLFAGKEYAIGLNEVMEILDVPTNERNDIGAGALVCAEWTNIPYLELSPLNQFIVAVYPYILYCLKNKLPDDEKLKEEADALLNDGTFPRYVQEEFGLKISQEVKGALWHPGIS